MAKETNKEQTLRYLPFKGKQDEWTMWSAKFMSRARKKKYVHILTGKQKVTFEDEANKTDEEKALEKLNDEAYDDLIMSIDNKVAFNKVSQAKTSALSEGCAYMAWTNFINKYKPRTVQSRAEKKLKFSQSKLEDWTKDPDESLDALEELKSDLELMNSKISDKDFKIHVLNNLPKEYESLVEKLIPDISILSLSDLREELQ